MYDLTIGELIQLDKEELIKFAEDILNTDAPVDPEILREVEQALMQVQQFDLATEIKYKAEPLPTRQIKDQNPENSVVDKESARRQYLRRANDILSGQDATWQEMYRLSNCLLEEQEYGVARKVLARARRKRDARGGDTRLRLAQLQARATYRDPDLPAEEKLDRAFEILQEIDYSQLAVDPETLDIAGAICRHKWELTGHKHYLERSLSYFLNGYKQCQDSFESMKNPSPVLLGKLGYIGVRTVFILDLLAKHEEVEAQKANATDRIALAGADAYRARAIEIREHLTSILPEYIESKENMRLEKQWLFTSIVAEAFFGLENYEEAKQWLRKAAEVTKKPETNSKFLKCEITELEKENLIKRLGQLTHLTKQTYVAPETVFDLSEQKEEPEEVVADKNKLREAKLVLEGFLKELGVVHENAKPSFSDNIVENTLSGKIGLALSGGGFRASFFHIGVLARLAELDVLRKIEVLSCVSGGSIIGAHYYLEVRNLLERKRDEEIVREDYIEIVKRIEKTFLEGVKKNLRVKVAANFWADLWKRKKFEASRIRRIGDIYEEELFSKVKEENDHKVLYMKDLKIYPRVDKGKDETFSPRRNNWRRAAKVPILIINATSLNTGHNWQFTTTWMGEPQSSIDAEIDGNYRLRRVRYEDAPEEHQKMRLGHAVAASSCVPGLFDPLTLKGLYENIIVRLVDGGVYDNQGTASLLEQECTQLLVSDASGQMNSDNDPSASPIGVPLRSNNILQARIRQAQYRELQARNRTSLLHQLMFVHLKKDLDVDPVDWVNCAQPYDASEDSRPIEKRGPLTSYGIRKVIQNKLAAMRTDLDSFSDAEAFSLMASGYCMTRYEYPRTIPANETDQEQSSSKKSKKEFKFLEFEAPIKEIGRYKKLSEVLSYADRRAFRWWWLSPELKRHAIAAIVFCGIASFIVALVLGQTLGGTFWVRIGVQFAMMSLSLILVKILWLQRRRLPDVFSIGLLVVLSLPAIYYLKFFNSQSLQVGSLMQVLSPEQRKKRKFLGRTAKIPTAEVPHPIWKKFSERIHKLNPRNLFSWRPHY